MNLIFRLCKNFIKILIISNCKSIKNLKLSIDEDKSNLKNGKLFNINAECNDLIYKNLCINYINIFCNSIDFELQLNKRKFNIRKDFYISCITKFNEEFLLRNLQNKEFEEIKISMCSRLIRRNNLKSILFKNNNILLIGYDKEIECDLEISNNNIIFKSKESKVFNLPIDQNIKMEKIFIKDKYLYVYFNSIVKSI